MDVEKQLQKEQPQPSPAAIEAREVPLATVVPEASHVSSSMIAPDADASTTATTVSDAHGGDGDGDGESSNNKSSPYDRFSGRQKAGFTAILALCGILSPFASTGSLTAVPQIASDLGVTGDTVNVGNALYTGGMALSAYAWGALGSLAGRRAVLRGAAAGFLAASLGSALAPNLAAFFAFRALSGLAGTGFLVVAPGVIGDLYRPTERATALGWVLSGMLTGPAIGPLVGGIIVTYSEWRNIYWLQTGVAGLACVLAVAFIPETMHHRRRWDDLLHLHLPPPGEKGAARGRGRVRATRSALALLLDPRRPLGLFARRADLALVALASSSLMWNMYAFLAPIVYVINPRLGLTSPLQSGLFYLAPGAGYLAGTFFGGRWADVTVRRWIRRRGGERRAGDRLRAVLPWMGLGTPACMLIYGWCLEFGRGGIPVLVIVMFIQGFTQLMIFPALNTYCLDVLPSRSTEVIGGNFLFRYLFAAAGTALALPATSAIGIGWFCTISALFIELACLGLLLVIYGWWPCRSSSAAPAPAPAADDSSSDADGSGGGGGGAGAGGVGVGGGAGGGGPYLGR
ncbi:major facilitator superfamily domain-containing protein [Xylariaceae sp. FL0804]|nr:major facilitator superfamily domain-containing protein [Xylariaceae sp. FL0804]